MSVFWPFSSLSAQSLLQMHQPCTISNKIMRHSILFEPMLPVTVLNDIAYTFLDVTMFLYEVSGNIIANFVICRKQTFNTTKTQNQDLLFKFATFQ
jgi:hypothetical protein